METPTRTGPPVDLDRLVRLLWWTGFMIVWVVYLLVAIPCTALILACEWLDEIGLVWLKARVESLKPNS